MQRMEELVAAASERPMNSSSSCLLNGGSHQTSHIVKNGHVKEEEIVDIKVNRTVQVAKDEVVASEQPSLILLESVMDKVVKVNRSESEENDQTKNGTLEDNNNNVQKGNGGKKNKQILIEGDENDDDVEVEEVELEFENVIPKLHNHNAYCPNCDAKITKVILRRKIPKKIIMPSVTITTQQNEERELVGCFSCFGIFMPKGKMLHPFPIFGGGADDTADIAEASSQQFQSIPKSAPKGVWNSIMADNAANAKRHGYERLPLPTVNSGDMSINIRDLPGTSGLSTNLLPITEVQSNSLEIVKSIVYGGLIGSRTSLSLVSSAAASGAATRSRNAAIGFLGVGDSVVEACRRYLGFGLEIPCWSLVMGLVSKGNRDGGIGAVGLARVEVGGEWLGGLWGQGCDRGKGLVG
ncbi:hypothetical protein LIER_11034 [Lithospermum erythrorhizon]|uniref:Uncharacterized protein n=1 Tax=Lithospermum erythrorhizon TaxID=34254 RepID=A0AAV3PRM8_LITER